jgi:hypothetical protein
MPRRSTIAEHRERAAIELAIARGVSYRSVAKRYGVSVDAVGRHAREHMPPQLRAKLIAGPDLDIDLERLRETESQSLLVHLVTLRNRLFASLDVAEECGDSAMVARVAHQLHENLTITGKLIGDLGVGSTTINNFLITPIYVEMRTALVRALEPFPKARVAVAAALRQIENKSAAQVQADADRQRVPK